ncbi:MAG: hypothetical protein KA004_11115 [Verrucomicrobiales bacterium]|nr:hypothetical protein [Verrucomicrobiales bacterium]
MRLGGWLVWMALHLCVPHGMALENPSEEEMNHPEETETGDAVGPQFPGGLPHDVTLELPEWTPEDLREIDENGAPANLGGGLWPSELWPLLPEPRRLPPPPSGHLASASDPASAEATEPVPVTLHPAYFGALPAESVVDPQSLVGEQRQEELSDFVRETTGQTAGIPLRILVFAAHQKLPDELPLDALADRWFGEKDGFIAAYFMGRPQRAILTPSSALRHRFAAEQVTNVRDSAVREATVVTPPEEQIARFCIKAAVRIYQLQQEGPRLVPQESQSARGDSRPHAGNAKTVWAMVLTGLAALLAWWLWHRQRREKPPATAGPWLLPDQEGVPRLGAPHCGGHAAAIKFKTAKA